MTFRHHAAVLATVFAVSAAWTSNAQAQPDPSLAEVPLPRLQAMVLPCDLKAAAGPADTPATAFCAAAADELRRRAFGGDRERLLAWWQAQRAARGAASAVTGAPTATAPRPISDATPAQLKASYLQCNRLAETTRLDFGTAANCSLVYEALKARVFEGDFQRLLAWTREQRAAATAAVAGAGATTQRRVGCRRSGGPELRAARAGRGVPVLAPRAVKVPSVGYAGPVTAPPQPSGSA